MTHFKTRVLLAALLGGFFIGPTFAQNYSPLPDLKVQFLNNLGAIVPGGKLCTYAAGTTTPQATFSDAAGTPNTNPVTFDSSGRANVWVNSNAYKFSFYLPGTGNTCNGSQVGTLVWTVDDYRDFGLVAFTAGALSGSGTAGVVPKFTASGVIGNSSVSEGPSGLVVNENLVVGAATDSTADLVTIGTAAVGDTASNASTLQFYTNSSRAFIDSNHTGTGTTRPLAFAINGTEAVQISTAPFVQFTGSYSGATACAVGTVGIRNNAGALEVCQNGGAWSVIPSGSGSVGGSGTVGTLTKFTAFSTISDSRLLEDVSSPSNEFLVVNERIIAHGTSTDISGGGIVSIGTISEASGTSNASVVQIFADSNRAWFNSTKTNSGTTQPIALSIDGSEAIKVSTSPFLQLTGSYAGVTVGASGTVAIRNNAGGIQCSQNGGAWGSCLTAADAATLSGKVAGSSLTAGQLIVGNGSSTIQVGNLSGDAMTSGTTTVTVAKVNGVVYTASPATDTAPVITGANTATYTAIPNCGDSTHAIAYSTGTHLFSCQAISTAATAGGANTQLQYNNATALGGISGATTNGTAVTFASAAFILAGSGSGTTVINAAASASGTITIPAATDTLVGKSTTDTLANKTLDNTTTETIKDANLTVQDDGDTTKQAKFQASGITTGTTRTLTIPDANTTIVGTDATQTLTNKTVGVSNILTARDDRLTIQDDGDATKQAVFQASGIATGTTRTFTLPDQSFTLAGTSSTLTSGQLIKGAGGKAIDVGDLSGDATTAGGLAVTVVKVNGVSFSSGPSTHTVPVITASNTATYKALPNCGDSTHALAFSTGTDAFSCQAISTAATAGGSNTQVQYNNATALGGIVGMTTDGTIVTVASGDFKFAGGTSGTTTVNATATASGTLTLPAATDTLVARNTTDTLTNKTFDNTNIYTTRDDRLTWQDNVDTTKQAQWQLNGITTGQTRVYTLPDATTTLVGTDTTQTVTNKTFDNSDIHTIRDDRLTLQDNGDTTKQAVFQLSGITTATTRTFTLPDTTATLAPANGDISLSAAAVIVNKVNGVAYSSGPSTHTVPVITASNTATYKALPNCGDFHDALAFATGTDAFSCQAVGRDIILGSLLSANFNSTSDQSITMPSSATYIIRKVVVRNASISLTTAAGGIYTATTKGGSQIVPSSQNYTFLTSSTPYLDAVLGTAATDQPRTEATLYLSLTTAQGAAAIADIYIIGDRLN